MRDTPPVPPGLDACGCCDGIKASTPAGLSNRAGLDAISYRIGDYAQFRESLHAGLSSPRFPELAGLRTRNADDFTLGLLDAVACAADVLTFYQERLANESYLRTAIERVSLQEMGKLIGYRLRPGVAAETWLAFALETPRFAPAGLPPEPGAFVTGIPDALTLAAGLKVQSVPGPGEKPQTFETVEDMAARPKWNAIRPWLSEVRDPGPTDFYLAGMRSNLKPGDALVFVDPAFFSQPASNTHWNFRRIDSVETDDASDRTRVSWNGALSVASSGAGPLQVHALRKRASVFGHNAPMWRSMSRQFRHGYPGGKDATEWPDFTLSELAGHIDLDAVFGEIKPGGMAVLTRLGFNTGAVVPTGSVGAQIGGAAIFDIVQKPFTGLYQVSSVNDVSLAAFALSGKVTRLGLRDQGLSKDFFDFVRETSVYAQSELLKLAPYPVTEAVSGPSLQLAVSPDGFFSGRKLIVTGLRDSDGSRLVHQATLVEAKPHQNGALLTITPPLPATLRRETVVVHANVALATHGETVSQILGAGDAGRSFQRFELQRLPLTYRGAANASGADSELSVRVGEVEWAEKPTLYGATAAERAYVLSVDGQGKSWMVFGDGVRGARLPSGVNNVRARYRQGLGQEGNVGADQLTQLMSRPLGLKSVSNPVSAQGGTDPEPADQARRTMPLGTRTLGRVVSLLDYEDFAMAFAGIAKARAAVLQLAGGPTIALTVAGQDGAQLSTSNPVWNNLLLALKASGDPHVNVALLPCQKSTFHLGLKIRRDPAYEPKALLAAVEAALRSRYAFDARALGQPVMQSEVIAVVHSVPGVVAVDLDFLYGGTAPKAQAQKSRQTRLLAARMHASGGAPMPAELLTLDTGPLDRLEEMP
ncbi:putative baseplate assembly protein [Polaromonas sp.]|uniref:putative baseplate assembly protein n=1 Tax=Polaromonas sp. TaxID=1869339 RepID=UPI0013B71524|nr:putative baseplate assembly protein [Polaromonas sp.]NDP63651.1 putative baseplate assembly protein [Polaromonas sp.]